MDNEDTDRRSEALEMWIEKNEKHQLAG